MPIEKKYMNRVPVVVHIPHWSTLIPADCQQAFLLDEKNMGIELLKMTDRLLIWLVTGTGRTLWF